MYTRRKTLKQISKAALLVSFGGGSLPGSNWVTSKSENYTVLNPYEGVNWEKILQIPSATHVHITTQEKLDQIYHVFKLRHIPISNYYPSAPYYPLNQIRDDQFKVEQNFGVTYNPKSIGEGRERWEKGTFEEGPFDWNEIIMNEDTGWYDELSAEHKGELPFKLGDKTFKEIPNDIIISPNAEHHSFTNSSLHANAVGSLYSSGTFDAHSVFKTLEKGYCYGTGLTWQAAFKKMINELLFEDGGGITINHPTWSGLSFDEVCQMLDYDERVLGIEVFNDTCATGYGEPARGWALQLWDKALQTGRKCYGFFVPDHTVGRGKNILLVPEFTEFECLKAYREGAFYGVINGTGLGFSSIEVANHQLHIGLNKTANIRLVADNREVLRKGGIDSLTFDIPLDTQGKPKIKYIRVEAFDEISEQIYSQPIMFP